MLSGEEEAKGLCQNLKAPICEEKTIVKEIRKSVRRSTRAAVLVLGSTLFTSAADAQWAVTRLNPTDAIWSQARAASGVQQAGVVYRDGFPRASLWTGTAFSWVDLNPAGSTLSIVNAAGGGQQAGVARIGGVEHAGLWSGSAASWVDLNPPGSAASEVFGMGGGQQGGYGPNYAAVEASREEVSLVRSRNSIHLEFIDTLVQVCRMP